MLTERSPIDIQQSFLFFAFNIYFAQTVPFFLFHKHKINYDTMRASDLFLGIYLSDRAFDCRSS